MIIACVTAFILPLINAVGVAATGAIFAAIAWLGFGCVVFSVLIAFRPADMSSRMFLLTIKYGDRMRAWVDVGYSTVRDN